MLKKSVKGGKSRCTEDISFKPSLGLQEKQLRMEILLQEAEELNIPRRNCILRVQELEKAIFETQGKYNDATFANASPICPG